MLLFGVRKQTLNNVAVERVAFVLDSVSISAAELDMTGLISCSDTNFMNSYSSVCYAGNSPSCKQTCNVDKTL